MEIQIISENILMNLSAVVFLIVFSLSLIISIVFLISLTKHKRYKRYNPDITIIIPAYNEEKNVVQCIESIKKNRYRGKMQIVCVDDGSTDRTKERILSFSGVDYIYCNHKGKSHALNTGLKKARYDLIVSLDADTRIEKRFLAEIVKPLKDKKVGATNGIALIQAKNLWESFQSVEFFFHNMVRSSFSRVFDNGIWFFGAAACYRKNMLDRLKFSTNVLTEDMDISLRIIREGYDIVTVDDARYTTLAMQTPNDLIKQRMRWFFGGLQCIFRHFDLFLKESFAVKYLFFNQLFWSAFSFLIFPIVLYQVSYWMPQGLYSQAGYLFRWFSLLGPVFVIYKIPVWGISSASIFGVLSGLITTALILTSGIRIKKRLRILELIAVFFYFPYTLILNLSMILSVFKYMRSDKKFIK